MSDVLCPVPLNSVDFRNNLREVFDPHALTAGDQDAYWVLARRDETSQPFEVKLFLRDGISTVNRRDTRVQPELAMTCLHDGLVDKAEVLGWNKLGGGVYRSDGILCPDFRVRTGHRGPKSISRKRIYNAKFVSGTHLYLGQLNDVYGHFILETLGRCWALRHVADFTGDFVFQKIRKARVRPDDSYGQLFEAAGVDLRRVRIVEEDTRFERLIVPTAGCDLGKSLHDEQKSVYRSLVQKMTSAKVNVPPKSTTIGARIKSLLHRSKAEPVSIEPKSDLRLYLSRKKLPLGTHKFLNEDAVERVFEAFGFQIIYPETLTIGDQLALFSCAKCLAGANSSALHNSIFAPEGCQLLMLDGRTGVHGQADWVQVSLNHAYAQPLSIMECDSAFYIDGISRGRVPYLCDLAALRDFLRESLHGGPTQKNVSTEAAASEAFIGNYLVLLSFWLSRKNAFSWANAVQQLATKFQPNEHDLTKLKRIITYRSLRFGHEPNPTVCLLPDAENIEVVNIAEPELERIRDAAVKYIGRRRDGAPNPKG